MNLESRIENQDHYGHLMKTVRPRFTRSWLAETARPEHEGQGGLERV